MTFKFKQNNSSSVTNPFKELKEETNLNTTVEKKEDIMATEQPKDETLEVLATESVSSHTALEEMKVTFKEKLQETFNKRNLNVRATSELTNEIVSAFTESVVSTVLNGNTDSRQINIRNFGSFYKEVRKEHTARNPRTGETIEVGTRASIKFRPSHELRKVDL
jgi:nucleoid DNA-binding protein